MLKAGAMFFAVTVALIIAMLSGTMVMYAYLNRTDFEQTNQQLTAQRNARSGIELLLARPEVVAVGSSTQLDLFGNSLDQVTLERKQWGGFEIGVCTATRGNHMHSKAAIIGANLHPDAQMALYLADQKKPLSLCGHTVLKGTCYLPEAGVKRAYIEGQTFVGQQLVQGTVERSKRQLPNVNQEMLRQNMRYIQGEFPPNDSVIDIHKLPPTLHRGFAEKTLIAATDGPISLTSGSISGNVRIVSPVSVFIGAEVQLQDAIVHAPVIVVEDGFTGRTQLFASDSLAIGRNCNLHYPSVVALARRPDKKTAELRIGSGSVLNAVVVAWQQQVGVRNHLRVQIAENALVHGQLATNGLVELQGSIHGSLVCNGFTLRTPSSVYENHLLNAVIDQRKLSPHFVGINLLYDSPNRTVVKWLW